MTKESSKKKSAIKKKTTAPAKSKSDLKAIIIAVISTLIVCVAVTVGALLATGIIKLGGEDDKSAQNSSATIVENPSKLPQLAGNLVRVGDLRFYLPWSFEAGGKNDSGAFTYNLVNDEGWAQVTVRVDRSLLSPSDYLKEHDESLEVSDTNLVLYGTSWIQVKNGDNMSFATKLGNVIYAVHYNVKIESAATAEAAKMIPETLYMDRVYQK